MFMVLKMRKNWYQIKNCKQTIINLITQNYKKKGAFRQHKIVYSNGLDFLINISKFKVFGRAGLKN